MASGAPTADNAGVDVVQGVNNNQYAAPETNPAEQLASALAKTQPQVADFVGQLGAQMKSADEAKAHADAMGSSAASYADAVKSGKLQGPQSPWYIQAFNQDRAQIAGSEQAQSVIAQSETWQERGYADGGVAYQARLDKELGAIREGLLQVPGMHPQDADIGYQKGVAPLAANAVAQNNAYQIQSIKQQKVQDTTTLMETQITNAIKANPTGSPEDIMKSLQPQIDQARGIGFQDDEIKKMAFESIIGAAFTAKDPSILNLASASFMGGPALSTIADESGKPYGEQTGQASYYINREIEADATLATRGATQKANAEGQSLVDKLSQQYGYQTASLTPAQVQQFAQANGISFEGYAAGSKMLAAKLEGIVGLNSALVKTQEDDPQVAATILHLQGIAAKEGYNAIAPAVEKMQAMGKITLAQGMKLIEEGAQTDRSNATSARAAASADRQTAVMAQQALLAADRASKEMRGYTNDYAINFLAAAGDTGIMRNKQIQANFVAAGDHAYGAYLDQHPRDYQGARDAQRKTLNVLMSTRAKALWGPQWQARLSGATNSVITSAGTGTDNPGLQAGSK